MAATADDDLAPLTGTQWLICVLASIGFAFDIYELLMLPLILRPVIEQLGGYAFNSPEYTNWARALFFVPAIAGGVFGLLGGYLTDLWGRRRVLTYSILLYALSAFGAGFSQNLWQLLALRCLTFVGFCVEFVAAVAWLSELFSNPTRREKVLGYTQAFSSLGGLMVSSVYVLLSNVASSLPAIHDQHEPWRYTLISGLIPALPLILIRPFLPESPVWQEKKRLGTLKRPSVIELFKPELRKTTIVATLMVGCSYGAALGAFQHLPQIIPGLAEVKEISTAAGEAAGEKRAANLPAANAKELQKIRADAGSRARQPIVGKVQQWQEIGGLVGRAIFSILAVKILSRRSLMRVFQIPGLFIVPLVFIFPATQDLTLLKYGVFIGGIFTVAQLSFWGNYLPLVYPVHLRGTGEGFAANIGGRILGTSCAYLTLTISTTDLFSGEKETKLAYTAALMAFSVFLLGSILCFFLKEPDPKEMAE